MFDIYLQCLSNAILHRRAAVLIELSVGLCVAHDFNDDHAEARAMLTNVYASAGYNCLAPDGQDYKTINRRVNTSFLLADKIGYDAVHKAIGHLTGHRRVEAVQGLLTPLQLHAMDDVLAYCGRPRNTTPRVPPLPATQQMARRAADAPGVVHVTTKHLDLPVPPTASRAEVLDMVVKLVALAETLNHGKQRSSQK